MIVNTRRLFAGLLPRMRISAICDVGSMNGQDALAFSAAAPRSSVYAFEPNPVNFGLMAADRAMRERNICVVPLAASNTDGEAEFYLVEAEYAQHDPRRGMSSLYARDGECAPAAVVRVGTARLDTFLADKCPPDARVALWIDTEGTAYEVIEGLSGVAARVQLLHVEVETTACIGAEQKLYPQVKSLLARLGFLELATDHPRSAIQFNALYVRARLPAAARLELAARLVAARLRYLMVAAALALFPVAVHRYALRRRAVRC
jgi:FkbM family methyltransferase